MALFGRIGPSGSGCFVYLFLFLVDVAVSRIQNDFTLSCGQPGTFSIIQDCKVFVTCRDGQMEIGQCAVGQNFDVTTFSCGPSSEVDCSKHVAGLPSRSQSNRLKRASSFEAGRRPVPLSLTRRRRDAPSGPITKPWGKWVDGKYVPYLFALSGDKIDAQCRPIETKGTRLKNGRWVDKKEGGVVTSKWFDYDDDTVKVPIEADDENDDDVAPEEELQSNDIISSAAGAPAAPAAPAQEVKAA